MNMKLHFPNSAFLGNIDQFLASFNTADKKALSVTFNKNWISVHPVVLSMTVALGLEVKGNGGSIEIEPLEAKSKHYLERMGMFRLLGIDLKIHMTDHEPSGRFIPVTRITDSKELNKFLTEMVPLLHTNPAHAESIKYIMDEIVRNVLEHSRSRFGALVCAQYYQKSNSIKIGVADTGIGIKRSINMAHDARNDGEAITLALTPGVTGTTSKIGGGTEYNAGAGLFFIKSIAKVNRDFFAIYSGGCMYKLLKTPSSRRVELKVNPLDDRHSMHEGLPYWQGTVVGVDISLDASEEFGNLLGMIRAVYKKEIKEGAKMRFKRARFI